MLQVDLTFVVFNRSMVMTLQILEDMLTKEDAKNFATKDDLKSFADMIMVKIDSLAMA